MANTNSGINSLQIDSLNAPQLVERELDASTLAIHADDQLNHTPDVAPAIHVSTTFRYTDNPDKLVTVSELEV